MSSFELARGVKGTLPGGIFEPLRFSPPAMSEQRQFLRSHNQDLSPSPVLDSSLNNGCELNNLNDIASSRPVPLTALSARTNSRNKGSKQWKPFMFEEENGTFADNFEDNAALSESTLPKVRSHLSESVSYGTDAGIEGTSENRSTSYSHGREPLLEARGEANRPAWTSDANDGIQQNPLNYAAYQNKVLERSRNSSLGHACYAPWPSSVPDEHLAISGVQHGHSFIPDSQVMPGTYYHAQEPTVYDVPHYSSLSRRRYGDPMNAQYAHMLQYPTSQPEYGQFVSYDPIPLGNTTLDTVSSVSDLNAPLPANEPFPQIPTVLAALSHHSSNESCRNPSLAMSDFSCNIAETADPNRTQEAAEASKQALKDAVLRRIEQDEQALSERIERERKRVFEREQERRSLEQMIRKTSGPPPNVPGPSRNSIRDSATPSDLGSHAAENEGAKRQENERKKKELKDAVLAKIGKDDDGENKQKLKEDSKLSVRARRAAKRRASDKSSSGNENSPSSQQDTTLYIDTGKSTMNGAAEVLESTSTFNPNIATERTPKLPPGLSKPAYNNPAALSRAFDDFHVAHDARLKEADDWFHKGRREEDRFQQHIKAIADEYVDECEQSNTRAATSKEEKEGRRQMTMLIGNIIGSIKSYVLDDKIKGEQQQPHYFSDFEDVGPGSCESRPDNVRSYFYEDPARAQSNHLSLSSRSRSFGNKSNRKVLVNRPPRAQADGHQW